MLGVLSIHNLNHWCASDLRFLIDRGKNQSTRAVFELTFTLKYTSAAFTETSSQKGYSLASPH